MIGFDDLVVGEDNLCDRIASGVSGKRAGEALWPLAAHLGEGKLLYQSLAVLREYPLVEMTSGDNLEEKSGA